MKKMLFIIIICFTSLFFTSCDLQIFGGGQARAERILRENLRKRYNEEFVIFAMGKREDTKSSWYECRIYPAKYVGTTREYDEYYWAQGFVELSGFKMTPGDTYGRVLLNESANAFYGKKLKELFGDNFLAVINMKGYYKNTDFEKEMDMRKPMYKTTPDGNFDPMTGGIYIFGRVENDEDREWYRTQIYEFVRFLKETGTFEYVDLDIEVIDERVLTDEFQNSKDIKENLVFWRMEWEKDKIPHTQLFEKRVEVLNEIRGYNINFKNKISEINRSKVWESTLKWSYYTVLLYTKIYSPKYIKSNNLDDEKEKEYNNLNDIKFDMGGYYNE
jgi:hypothetical protein